MDERAATAIAREVLWQLVKCKEAFPGAFDYIAAEMNITDEEIEEANML
jgi:hypothetical protein